MGLPPPISRRVAKWAAGCPRCSKTNPASRAQYEAWGIGSFQPNATQTLKSYYQVPEEFLDDAAKLQELAVGAIDAAIDGQG